MLQQVLPLNTILPDGLCNKKLLVGYQYHSPVSCFELYVAYDAASDGILGLVTGTSPANIG
ncbi:MAG: hypothetical protein U5J96_01290 [Ignavibacteriaceae bacterium]|nr:hypothetical protein [Ignavibacteriaceae bacterium]